MSTFELLALCDSTMFFALDWVDSNINLPGQTFPMVLPWQEKFFF
jgi:hypothetical protein